MLKLKDAIELYKDENVNISIVKGSTEDYSKLDNFNDDSKVFGVYNLDYMTVEYEPAALLSIVIIIALCVVASISYSVKYIYLG